MHFHENSMYINKKNKICKGFEIDYFLMDFVFSDESENFVTPCEPCIGDNVRLRIRCGKGNADEVFIHLNGKPEIMEKEFTKGFFDYFYIDIKNMDKTLNYFFSLTKRGKVYYYNKKGLGDKIYTEYNFKVIPDFKTPDWAKGVVMYQIFVDRFFNGDTSNDVLDNEYAYLSGFSKKKGWNEPVEAFDVASFYGGDLQGIIDKMDYLKDLGIEAILLNPIFVSPSNHKYDIQDYDYVDPHFGVIAVDEGEVLQQGEISNAYATKYISRTTDKENLEKSNALLVKLIEIAHNNGIKVILDGVFNHCGSFNKWLDKERIYEQTGVKGAFYNKDSPYEKYFNLNAQTGAYDAWWGHLNHPKLNFEASEALFTEVMGIAKKWVSPPYNADGWRLDVAADLGYTKEFNHFFWQCFRREVKKANPEAIILAEHYGDPGDWLKGGEWDTIMNYDAFMEPVTWFLTGMEKHSDEFRGDLLSSSMAFEQSMRYYRSKLSIQSMSTAMNQLSNHDHSRFLTRTNKKAGRLGKFTPRDAETGINKAVMYEAVTLQMTWQGAPCVYYGDEAGLCGFTDPDNRRPYPWGDEDLLMIAFHKEAIGLRKKYSCLRTGSSEFLYNNEGILSFGRWDTESRVAVVINNSEEAVEISLPVWKIEAGNNSIFTRVLYTFNGAFDNSNIDYTVTNGKLEVKLKAFSSAVFVQKED